MTRTRAEPGQARPGATAAAVVAAVPAHEGPVYSPAEDALYVTTLPVPRAGAEPEVAILRIALDGPHRPVPAAAVSVVRRPAGAANGMALDLDGTLLVCEQGGPHTPAAVTRLDPSTGERTVLVDGFDGRPLSSPNDVVVAPDGAVWFTDPAYGFLQGFRPPPALPDAVYRLDRTTGRLAVASTEQDKPNGLAFSPDGRVLFVADSGSVHGPGDLDPRRPHHVVRYDVAAGGRLAGRRVVAEVPGYPDGLAVTRDGHLLVCCATGIRVHDGEGALLAVLDVPGAVNVTVGGRDADVAFVTTDTAVVSIDLHALPDLPD
jgi:gluconolactonase